MSKDCKAFRKITRKVRHCEGILLKYENIQTSPDPTNVLFIGNGGLGCGILKEELIAIFSSYDTKNIVMVPGRPYAFIEFKCIEEAKKAMAYINGQKLTSGHVFYLSYIHSVDLPREAAFSNVWPKGLILLKHFLTENEEKELLSVFHFEDSEEKDKTVLKHRKVKHYGYEFNYENNNVDKKKSLEEKIPFICIPHLERLVALNCVPSIPDQLTVNFYLPGQGIPPHIDTHSAFTDEIISFSLGSQVVMDFYGPGKEVVPILIPRRSVLIMSGPSRYIWKHGITPRKTDIVPFNMTSESNLTLCHRLPRTSLTFRLVREGKCDCEYREYCDSQASPHIENETSPKDLVNEEEAKELESRYVNQVYEEIADHFSNTRYKPWPKVLAFLKSIPSGSLILDIGCGNGKNMGISENCFEIGCDASTKLSQVCFSRNAQVVVADCLKLPFRSNCADVVICIAVIHHLSTKVRRTKAVEEIIRVLCPNGRALIYVWAFEQETPQGPSYYLKSDKLTQNFADCAKEHINNFSDAEIQLGDSNNAVKLIKMPVHKNRTNFIKQDMLVPWKQKKTLCQVPNSNKTNTVHHRYYHVFVEGELESLVMETGAHIISSYYDNGNWCVLFEK